MHPEARLQLKFNPHRANVRRVLPNNVAGVPSSYWCLLGSCLLCLERWRTSSTLIAESDCQGADSMSTPARPGLKVSTVGVKWSLE